LVPLSSPHRLPFFAFIQTGDPEEVKPGFYSQEFEHVCFAPDFLAAITIFSHFFRLYNISSGKSRKQHGSITQPLNEEKNK